MTLDASAGRAVAALALVVLARVTDAAPDGRQSGADCEVWGCGSKGSAGASAPLHRGSDAVAVRERSAARLGRDRRWAGAATRGFSVRPRGRQASPDTGG